MNTINNDNSLEHLISLLVDGKLTEEQSRQLESLIADDEASLHNYTQIMQVHALLKWSSAAPAVVASGQSFSDAPEISLGNEASISKGKIFTWTPWLFLAASVFAVYAFLANPQSYENVDANNRVATITNHAGSITQQWKPVWSDSSLDLPNWTPIAIGQELKLESGRISCMFDVGAELILQGPAQIKVLGPKLVEVDHGELTVRVSENGRGFSVKTAVGKVIDLGTEFGVSVAEGGETELVVFDGVVDLETDAHSRVTKDINSLHNKSRWRLEMGQAVRVASQGEMSRVTNVDFDRFPRSGSFFQLRKPGAAVITSVQDNLRKEGVGHYYQICRGGLEEDCVAYVDRHYQWNGIDKNGIPDFLLGADYVLAFNDDKVIKDLVPTITLSQAADVFVFWDQRQPPPEWLQAEFEKTDSVIGMDETEPAVRGRLAVGAGISVERKFNVWVRRVLDPSQPVTFGGAGAIDFDAKLSMYGIAAVALGETI